MTTKESFQENYPFMTCIKCNDTEYLGIIINFDQQVTSLYDFAVINNSGYQKLFLELGDVWWWESNRKIPINIFLKQDMSSFKPYIKTFNTKDVEVVFGPTVNLGDIAEKRVKRKSIQLVRNPKKVRP
jgi:hypothetical protein